MDPVAECELQNQLLDSLVDVKVLEARTWLAECVLLLRIIATHTDGALATREVSAVWGVGAGTAAARMGQASTLAGLLRLVCALDAGRLTVSHARALVEVCGRWPLDVGVAVETRLLPPPEDRPTELLDLAARWTPAQLGREAERLALEIAPELAAAQRREATRQRRLEVVSVGNGQAAITAVGPAALVQAVHDRCRDAARAAARAGRTPDGEPAAAFDSLVSLVLTGAVPADGRATLPPVEVVLLVPLETALGGDAAGHLVGHGPIDADATRALLPGARVRRAVVDERTGRLTGLDRTSGRLPGPRTAGDSPALSDPYDTPPLDPEVHWELREPPEPWPDPLDEPESRPQRPAVSWLEPWRPAITPPVPPRTRGPDPEALLALARAPLPPPPDASVGYRIPAALARFVALRDLTCCFPGCARPALLRGSTDLDHRRPWWQQGPTSTGNLAPLCRGDHRAKQRGWVPRCRADGSTDWVSPWGRRHTKPATDLRRPG